MKTDTTQQVIKKTFKKEKIFKKKNIKMILDKSENKKRKRNAQIPKYERRYPKKKQLNQKFYLNIKA